MSFPNVSEAMWDWESAIVFKIVKKTVVDFEVIEQPLTDTSFMGVLQPMPSRKLLIKPEGQRKWNFLTLFTEQPLQVDNILEDEKGRVYRVRSESNWSDAGFYEYDLTQGVQDE